VPPSKTGGWRRADHENRRLAPCRSAKPAACAVPLTRTGGLPLSKTGG